MRNQQKIIFHAVGFPITRSLAIVLFLDDKLFKRKVCVLKNRLKCHLET